MSRNDLRSIVSVCVVFLLVSSVLFFFIPTASGATWYEGTSDDFSDGTLSGVEIIGTGEAATIQLLKDFENWVDKSPSPSPSVREGLSLAYDPDDDVFLLFGGFDGAYLDDTWAYDASINTWTELTPSSSPPGREFAGMTYDTLNNVFVLYGGVSGAGLLMDTWHFDYPTQTWTETSPAISPTSLASNPLTFDESIGKVVLAAEHFGVGFETWTYDASTFVWLEVTPSPSPPVRVGHAVAYSPPIGKTVLFGGTDILTNEDKDDTWEYDGVANTWSEITTAISPPGMSGHGMAYRNWDGSVVLFGGENATTGYLFDTWQYYYVGPDPNWLSVYTTVNPSGRKSFGMDYDNVNNKTVVFGGEDGSTYLNDTWSLENTYRPTGNFESSPYDSYYGDTDWQYIWWNNTPADQPPLTTLRLHVATSNSSSGPWTFLGPACTGGDYYTTPGTSICASQYGRYARYRAYLISWDGKYTPIFDNMMMVYNVPPTPPKMMSTDPAYMAMGVDWWKNITVYFSEPMITGSVTYTIDPAIGLSVAWDSTESILYLNHSTPFLESKWYQVEITGGTDKDGNPIDWVNSSQNPWNFLTKTVRPWVDETEPAHLDENVPLAYPIWINFSEPMNTTTVTWTISPDEDLGWTEQWQNSNKTLYLTHSLGYTQCTWYETNVTGGEDTAGNPLKSGPATVPWKFKSECLNPYIVSTDPEDNAFDVALYYNITITFSEEINVSTFYWNITPDPNPGLWDETWVGGNTSVMLNHSVNFDQCTLYTVDVTAAEDVEGNPLMGGPVPNPFQFKTICINPFITSTSPADGEENVAVVADIIVVFSEAIDTPTFQFEIDPVVPSGFTEEWSPFNDMVTLSHVTPFTECTYYTANVIQANDPDGNPLVDGLVPNPWIFNTTCVSPVILETIPANATTNVDLNADIIIKFSKPMNTTIVWDIIPDDDLGWTEVWTDGDKTLTLQHALLFNASQKYVVLVISAKDRYDNPLVPGPVPNPWEFTTIGAEPYIMVTDPADGDKDVAFNYNITITFSEEIVPATVYWNITPDPNPSAWNEWWDATNTVLTLEHPVDFEECTQYKVNVTHAEDLDGLDLVSGPVPNPWVFTTICVSPYIWFTYPADGQTGVAVDADVIINFSESMDITTVTWSFIPSIAKTPTWSNNNMTLTLSPPLNFDECQTYNVTITGKDMDGNDLVAGPVPNPWEFTTICVAPYIVSTIPVDGQTGVAVDADVIINFSESMDITTVTWSFIPSIAKTPTWSNNNMTLTLSPPLNFDYCQNYNVTISGNDEAGLSLVAGPVPNPWEFSTLCELLPPAGLRITREFPNVNLTWSSVTNATEYRIYESQNKFASFPWPLLDTTTQTWYVAAGHLNDGLTHYYIVRAYNSAVGIESENSTMAAKIEKDFTFVTGRSNIYWMSLPYNSEYTKASDIANEHTGNIDVVGKWNRQKQKTEVYFFARGKWRGTDFTINAGDGIYVGVVTNFTWYIVGTDSSVSLNFTFSTQPGKTNRHWFSLPYTGSYRSASEIVADIEPGPGAPTKIIEVGKWDPVTQSVIRYYYDGVSWTGVDFSIDPGDGIYIKVIKSFDWQPSLITPEVP